MLAPKGFTQQITQEAYVAARLAASKRTGVLRARLPMMVLAAALAFFAVNTAVNGGFRPTSLVAAFGLLLAAAVIVYLFASVIPKQIKDTALRDFAVVDRLLGNVEVELTSDDVTLKSQALSRKTEFAKLRVCIETPTQYVLVGNDEFITLLQKAYFADREHTDAFLRDVCARWYVRERGGKG